MVLVPLDTPGVKVERMLETMGFLDPPGGHGEVSFTDVRLPAGAIIVVDECQKYMPARRGAADAPQWIKDLSTHRHLGLDFILISQHHTDASKRAAKTYDSAIAMHAKLEILRCSQWAIPSVDGIHRTMNWNCDSPQKPELSVKPSQVTVT